MRRCLRLRALCQARDEQASGPSPRLSMYEWSEAPMTKLVTTAKPMDMSCEASFWLEWFLRRKPASEPAHYCELSICKKLRLC